MDLLETASHHDCRCRRRRLADERNAVKLGAFGRPAGRPPICRFGVFAGLKVLER
jgi:hypothetical protein